MKTVQRNILTGCVQHWQSVRTCVTSLKLTSIPWYPLTQQDCSKLLQEYFQCWLVILGSEKGWNVRMHILWELDGISIYLYIYIYPLLRHVWRSFFLGTVYTGIYIHIYTYIYIYIYIHVYIYIFFFPSFDQGWYSCIDTKICIYVYISMFSKPFRHQRIVFFVVSDPWVSGVCHLGGHLRPCSILRD